MTPETARTAFAGVGKAADALSDALRKAESAIRRLHYGAKGCVELPATDESDPDRRIHFLCFGKIDKRWGLYISYMTANSGGELVEQSDLYNTSVAQRLSAAYAIPELVLKLRENNIDQLCEIGTVVQHLEEFSAGIDELRDDDGFEGYLQRQLTVFSLLTHLEPETRTAREQALRESDVDIAAEMDALTVSINAEIDAGLPTPPSSRADTSSP
jgi:hypothetical protein